MSGRDGFEIAKNIPVMAPHDWTGEGMTYGDLHAMNIHGNTPTKDGISSREFDWNTMCDAMPAWKGKEMKRSYYACIS